MLKGLKNIFGSKESPQNAELLQAMDKVARADTREHRTALYRALLDSRLLMPTPEIPSELKGKAREVVVPERVNLQIVLINDRDGRSSTAVFTDVEALRNWDPNTPYLEIASRAYFEMVRQSPVVAIIVNPFDPVRKMIRPGGRLMRFEFDSLADGYIPEGTPDATGGMKMHIAKPVSYRAGKLSGSIAGAVTETAKELPEIVALYSAEMVPEGAAVRQVIGVAFASGCGAEQKGQCIQRLGASAKKALQLNESIDFTEVDGAAQLKKQFIPFYSRAR